jgi:RimJ/RimL family protein N-acetyltransferase
MFTPIQTSRLTLRPFQRADLLSFLDYRNDPEVARYQSWESISEERGRLYIDEVKDAQPGVAGEWYQVAIVLRETGELIGDIGLGIEREDPSQGEIGFTLSREHQGKGYGAEAVGALLDFAFSELGLRRITGTCDTRNTASARLMQRVGMKYAGRTNSVYFKGEYCDEDHYAIHRDAWEAVRG